MKLPRQTRQSQPGVDSGADLYRDDRISVTPSWLSVDTSRYSIRTITRLDHDTVRPKPGIAYVFFFGAIVLMAYSLYQFTKPSLPALVPWIMLLASVAIFLYSASIAFRSKTNYQVVVTLLDGDRIPVVTANREQAQGLLDSLTLAMDWHRNSDVVIEAARNSHIRQAYAKSSRGESGKDPGKKAADKAVARDKKSSVKGAFNRGAPSENVSAETVVEISNPASATDPTKHPSRVERKLPLLIAAMLKGRD